MALHKSAGPQRFIDMKTSSFHAPQAALASLLFAANAGLAIEAPADNTPPPAAALEQEIAAQPQPPAKNSAFLGLISQPVPEILREHLGLQQGAGVMVRSVIPDSPAAKAGIVANDVITRVDNKEITTPEELTKAISAHQPGDELKISVVHKGKSADLNAKLGERPAQLPLAGGAPGLQDGDEALNQLGIPDEFADRIRKMLEDNAGGVEFPFLKEGLAIPEAEQDPAMEDMQKRMGEMRKRIDEMRKQAGGGAGGMQFKFGGGGGNFQFQQGATFRMMDDKGSVEIKSNNGSKEVIVRDPDNNIIWNGPWDTPQDKAAAPDDIRERIERLNIQDGGNGLKLQLQPQLER